jgi:3-oxoacyl-[acyl-carrier-protein] synthase-3
VKYTRVAIESIGYVLPPNVVSSSWLEEQLGPVYRKLNVTAGQLEAWTGIRERRWWDPGFKLSEGAARAAKKALAASSIGPEKLGALVYAGVGRENFEPATACAVAEAIGVPAEAAVYDISNACLGVLNGVLDLANRIELGQIEAGMVVSCESAREINEVMMRKLLERPTMDLFKNSMATLTGGSGAVAILLSDASKSSSKRRLVGGVQRTAPEHHRLCRWGLGDEGGAVDLLTRGSATQWMETDAVSVLKHGVELGRRTWQALLGELGWSGETVDRVICHQVGTANRDKILDTIGVDKTRDFSTYEFLGNIGTVSLPLTASLADERDFLRSGQRVGWLGIGSGLNCLMLGIQW